MFKKNKFKGGLLSDVVSPEIFQEMIGADCNQGGCKPSNQNEGAENSEAKPAEETTAPTTDVTPPATETKADTGTSTTENTDDASWKSKPSEPASENTDDGNQGCKKSSNQSEYAEEIGLVEATQILSDIEIDIEKKEVAGEEVPAEELDLVESMQTAVEATTEIVEQKDIMDEAVANDELTPTAVSIFKENCEDYLEKTNGECKNEAGETVPYIDSESAGLESDSKQALKAKYNAIWDVTRKTVDKTIYTVKKTSKTMAGLQFFGFGKKEKKHPFLDFDEDTYQARREVINSTLKKIREDFTNNLKSGRLDPLKSGDIGGAINNLNYLLPKDKTAISPDKEFIDVFSINFSKCKEWIKESKKNNELEMGEFIADNPLGRNIESIVEKNRRAVPVVDGVKMNKLWLMDNFEDLDIIGEDTSAYISLGEFFPEIDNDIVKWAKVK